MELTFPFRNFVINTLLSYLEPGFIHSFAKFGKDAEQFTESEFDAKDLPDRVVNFENELLQTIETTNQQTIDSYFQSLRDVMYYIRDLSQEEPLRKTIKDWNEKQLSQFNTEVEEKTAEYFDSPDRERKHLETFDAFSPF